MVDLALQRGGGVQVVDDVEVLAWWMAVRYWWGQLPYFGGGGG